MRTIHPFPARMAPDTVSDWLHALPTGAVVLDPMCGSGVVVRQAALLRHNAIGCDIDPLAVIMSGVWTKKGDPTNLFRAASDIADKAQRSSQVRHDELPWVLDCPETQAFIEYWFAEPQRSALAALALQIENFRHRTDPWTSDALRLALSRIIITKQAGASLAWDVSHSRPHRKIHINDFDVISAFLKSSARLAALLQAEPLPKSGDVFHGDCRNLSTIKTQSVDAVITSPPYLNAIDYLRGHKFSLVWMGYRIPLLRNVRSGAVGTERAGKGTRTDRHSIIELAVPQIDALPTRQQAIVRAYVNDAERILCEFRRITKLGGQLILVIGDSNLRGVPIYNSSIFRYTAEKYGFQIESETRRPLHTRHRYLPITSGNGALTKRMKQEVVQAYRLPRSA